MNDKPKRRWFQFRLKTLLVVITVLCLGPGGYVAYEQRKAREQMAAVLAIEQLGGLVVYDDRVPVRSPIMRQILGDESFGNVHHVNFGAQANDASLVHLAPLKNLKSLNLTGTQVTDAGLAHLASLPRLEDVRLQSSQVTEAGAARLQKARPNCLIITDTRPWP